jgi:hypothetical protein
MNTGAAPAAPGASHAPRPAHAPRPTRAPRRPASSRTARHGAPGLISDLPPATRHPQLDSRAGIELAGRAEGQPVRFMVPDGRGPPRASPFGSFALLLPILASFQRRLPRLRAARRRPSRHPRPNRSPAFPDRVRRTPATPAFRHIRAPPTLPGFHALSSMASVRARRSGQTPRDFPPRRRSFMSGIRTILIASVLALGVGLAPVAQAESPAPATAKATTAPTPTSTSHTKSTSSKSSKSTAHIDLNSASREQLMTLPGIDAATADKIVEARPFKSKDELHSKGIVSKAEYDKLASHVTAKSAKPMSK